MALNFKIRIIPHREELEKRIHRKLSENEVSIFEWGAIAGGHMICEELYESGTLERPEHKKSDGLYKWMDN
jgi:hypothetical protein